MFQKKAVVQEVSTRRRRTFKSQMLKMAKQPHVSANIAGKSRFKKTNRF